MSLLACHQRFAAWRSGGFLAQMFNRRTALEPTTKLSYEALNPPLRQTAVEPTPSVKAVHDHKKPNLSVHH
jgi:hypothetical protein